MFSDWYKDGVRPKGLCVFVNVKWCRYNEKQVGFNQTLAVELLYILAIQFLILHPRELKVNWKQDTEEILTRSPFIEALLLITNACKEPKCSSTVDREKYDKYGSIILKNIICLGKKGKQSYHMLQQWWATRCKAIRITSQKEITTLWFHLRGAKFMKIEARMVAVRDWEKTEPKCRV